MSRGSNSIPTHLLGNSAHSGSGEPWGTAPWNKGEVLSPPGIKPAECWYLKPTAASCVYGSFRFAGGGEGNQNSGTRFLPNWEKGAWQSMPLTQNSSQLGLRWLPLGGREGKGRRGREGGAAGLAREGRKQVSSHRHPSAIQRRGPRRTAVPTWRGTYRLCTGPCNLSSPLYPLHSHQKCNHNRGQCRPTAPRRKKSPRPPATGASSGKAFPTPSSSPGGKGGDGTRR